MQSNMLNNYALLIGVEDYSIYDRSVDQPKGTSDLSGAARDACALYHQCIAMGFAPERVRVLTSPRLSPADLGPEAKAENVGEATHDAIVAGVEWIARAVNGPAPASGVISFSGHGAQDPGVAVCPSDTTGSLEQVIRIADVWKRIGAAKAAENLTVVLDCCHAAVGRQSIQAKLRARASGEPAPAVSERVLAACQKDQESAYAVFGGKWMGAFTWALSSTMSQWNVSISDGVARLDIDNGELLKRAGKLLEALSFKQVPALTGPKDVEKLSVLQAGVELHEGWTKSQPNRARKHGQLVPWRYVIWYGNTNPQTYLAAINCDNNSGTEQWDVVGEAAYQVLTDAQRNELQSITMRTYSANDWPTVPKGQSWTMGWAAENVDWNGPNSTNTISYDGTCTFIGPYDNNSQGLAIGFEIVQIGAGVAQFSNTYWYNIMNSNVDLNTYSDGAFAGNPVTTSTFPQEGYNATSPLSYSEGHS